MYILILFSYREASLLVACGDETEVVASVSDTLLKGSLLRRMLSNQGRDRRNGVEAAFGDGGKLSTDVLQDKNTNIYSTLLNYEHTDICAKMLYLVPAH